jgi:Lon protease-like protein
MELVPIQFGREIAIFPLPNCVLFPGVVQPLHIFEPRYRQMMTDVVEEDGGARRAMAMALLKSGWEKSYYGCPPINEMVCVGRVIAHELVDDGKYNLLLQGVVRARVKQEQRRSGPWGSYRVAILEPVLESCISGSSSGEALQRRMIRELFEKTPLKDLTVTPALAALFEEEDTPEHCAVPLGRLVDALAFSLVQDVQCKQKLLETLDPALRAELLLREMVALAGRLGSMVAAGGGGVGTKAESTWPPELGMN